MSILKSKLNVSSILLIVAILFFCTNNVYAARLSECPFCSSKNYILYRKNSTKGLTEKIYYCKDCKKFFQELLIDEDIKNIIESNDENNQVDDENNQVDDENKNIDNASQNEKTNVKQDNNVVKEDNNSSGGQKTEKRDNTLYDSEPEGDYYVEKIDNTQQKVKVFSEPTRSIIDDKDISIVATKKGALMLFDKKKGVDKCYSNEIVTVVDDKNNKVITWYFDDEGLMQIGWKFINNSWYYFSTEANNFIGNMAIGWQKIKDKYYYFDNDGRLLVNTITPDGYRVNKEGEYYENEKY